MLNSATIMGRLTATPEIKTTVKGVSVTSFTVATENPFNGEVCYIKVVVWREKAEFVTRYFEKGSMIAIQGYIQPRKYEDKNGIKRTVFEIVATHVSFCGSKAEAKFNNEINELASCRSECVSTASYDDFDELDAEDDELPF